MARIALFGAGVFAVLIAIVCGYNWYDTDGVLTDTRDTLAVVRGHESRLIRDSIVQQNTALSLDNQLKQNKVDKLTAQNLAKDAQIGQQAAQQQVYSTSRQLSAAQAKLAADRPVAGIGPVPTTDRDSVLNREITYLKDLHVVKDTTINRLSRANAVLTVENQRLDGQVSDLERELNGAKTGYGRVRRLVQDEISDAKGLFRGGRRRALRRVDAAVAKEQL